MRHDRRVRVRPVGRLHLHWGRRSREILLRGLLAGVVLALGPAVLLGAAARDRRIGPHLAWAPVGGAGVATAAAAADWGHPTLPLGVLAAFLGGCGAQAFLTVALAEGRRAWRSSWRPRAGATPPRTRVARAGLLALGVGAPAAALARASDLGAAALSLSPTPPTAASVLGSAVLASWLAILALDALLPGLTATRGPRSVQRLLYAAAGLALGLLLPAALGAL